MTHPDTPELDKILDAIFFNSNIVKQEAKASLTRLLAKRELEGRIDELLSSDDTIRLHGIEDYQDYFTNRLAELREELAKYETAN